MKMTSNDLCTRNRCKGLHTSSEVVSARRKDSLSTLTLNSANDRAITNEANNDENCGSYVVHEREDTPRYVEAGSR